MSNEVIRVFVVNDRRKANFSMRYKSCKMKSKEKYLTIVQAIKEKTNDSMCLAKFLTGKMITCWHICLY